MPDLFLTYLLNGDFLGFVVSIYTSSMGQGFYAFVLLIVFGAIYNRTKSVALCSILWLLLGGGFISLSDFSMISPIAVLLVAAGLTGIVFSLVGRRSK